MLSPLWKLDKGTRTARHTTGYPLHVTIQSRKHKPQRSQTPTGHGNTESGLPGPPRGGGRTSAPAAISGGRIWPAVEIRNRNRQNRAISVLLTLSFLSLFLLELKNTRKTRTFYPYCTPQILGKERKKPQKSKDFLEKENQGPKRYPKELARQRFCRTFG